MTTRTFGLIIGLIVAFGFGMSVIQQFRGTDVMRIRPTWNSQATAEQSPPWYERAWKPSTLKEALAAEKQYLGADNAGYRRKGDARLCAAMHRVMLACDYNTRATLSMFLTVNGKGLFPASGGTNPYNKEAPRADYPDDGYIGTAQQNEMLLAAVRRNAWLFSGGDLAAATVRQLWR